MSNPVPTADNPRALRGLAIVAKGDTIEREGKNKWHVPSQSPPEVRYTVESFRGAGSGANTKPRWTCTCPDHATRGVDCKHIHAAKFTEAARKQLQVILPGNMPKKPRARRGAFAAPLADYDGDKETACKFCGNAEVVRNGFKSGKQEYRCRSESCGRAFVQNEGFARLKGDARTVCLALDLYFKGNSLRQITDTLNQFFGLRVAHMTVYRWLQRYVALINEYAAGLEPWVGDKWHADEVFTKFNGNLQYLWHVMDAETRYLLVSHVTTARTDSDAKDVMGEARRLAGKTPDEIVTDGLPAYVSGIASKLRGAKHTREIHLSNPGRFPNNNRVERLNGTVRARQKPARGLKSPGGPLTAGQQAYYNLLRPHSALDGRTPAEAAGVGFERGESEPRVAALIRAAVRRG